jgi:hypothetical protein
MIVASPRSMRRPLKDAGSGPTLVMRLPWTTIAALSTCRPAPSMTRRAEMAMASGCCAPRTGVQTAVAAKQLSANRFAVCPTSDI